MRVLITGANGFIGKALAERLLTDGVLVGQKISRLLLVDQSLPASAGDERVRLHRGNVADPRLLRRLLADGMDVVYHLASVPGGKAESDYALGYQVNLLGSLELIDQLRQLNSSPRLVFASSIAVYGDMLGSRPNERSPAQPDLSYGAHKRMIELLIEDLGRRDELDGCSVRLPGVVARPAEPNGLKSAFMSDLLTHYASGRRYICPVSEQATAWWVSLSCCVDNLIRLAELNPDRLAVCRTVQLPVLQLSIAQVVEALARRYGDESRSLIEFAPDAALEAVFGRYPAMRTPVARALGLRHDGNADSMIRNALSALQTVQAPAARQSPQSVEEVLA